MRENVTQGSDGSCSQLLASHMWWNSLQKTPIGMPLNAWVFIMNEKQDNMVNYHAHELWNRLKKKKKSQIATHHATI